MSEIVDPHRLTYDAVMEAQTLEEARAVCCHICGGQIRVWMTTLAGWYFSELPCMTIDLRCPKCDWRRHTDGCTEPPRWLTPAQFATPHTTIEWGDKSS